MTIAEALASAAERLRAAGIEEARLDAQLLLGWVLKARREDLAREPERTLSDREQIIFQKAVALRAGRRPLAYITGERTFFGRSFKVNRAVLVPRPETELVVGRALERLRRVPEPLAADLGTGSGCIAVTLAAERHDATVAATDISPLALLLARKNAARHGVADRVAFLEGDLCAPLPVDRPYDAIVSNPPYVAEAEMADLEAEVRDYEPRLALTGGAGATGPEGTGLYPHIFACARRLLAPGRWVLVEIGLGQADAVAGFARAAGLEEVGVLPDYGGIPRVVEARA